MTRTHPSLPPLVPAPIQQWAHDFVAACFRERLARAGLPECALCGERNALGRADCARCGLSLSEATAPCLACGRENTEREVEDAHGYCVHCLAPWTGTSERVVLVPYVVPVAIDDETIPF
jgi:predicted amidophosphoribosyltransferase